MARVFRVIFLLSILLLWVPGTWAEDFSHLPRVEVTPFIGYRGGGDVTDQKTNQGIEIDGSQSVGLIIDWPSGPTTQWELLYSLQKTEVNVSSVSNEIDLDIHYIHLGGIYLFEGEGLNPFLGFTLGATHADPSGFDSQTFFSFAFTGGLKYFPFDRMGIRLDGRAYGTVTGGNAGFLCSGGCIVYFQGDAFWQFEGILGLIFRF